MRPTFVSHAFSSYIRVNVAVCVSRQCWNFRGTQGQIKKPWLRALEKWGLPGRSLGRGQPSPQKKKFRLEWRVWVNSERYRYFFKSWGQFALASPVQVLGARPPAPPPAVIYAHGQVTGIEIRAESLGGI